MVNPRLVGADYHFEFGTSVAYGGRTTEEGSIGSDSSFHDVATHIAGLNPGTTYHFRVVATNPLGSAFGGDQVFTTPEAPTRETPGGPTRCRKGFVKKHGKCVKKKAHRRHKKQRKHNRRRDG
jgi:hypothetical protein